MESKPTIKEIEEYMAGYNMGSPILPDTIPSVDSAAYDTISKPKHYMLFEPSDIHPNKGIEVRDVIEKLADKIADSDIDEEPPRTPYYRVNPLFTSDYVQLMQYLMRFMDKNGVEDLKKARWYLDKMIEAY
jgi:Fe-S oxidoreductase